MGATSLAVGLVRDFVAAVCGVLLVMGLLTQELIGGILLIVTTGGALAAWGIQAYRASKGGSAAK